MLTLRVRHTQTVTDEAYSAYPAELNLTPSALRPHCAAKLRLRLWKPLTQRSKPSSLATEDISRIQDVMCHAWAESTHESYSSGLLVYHVYCDSRSIPEEDRAPASSTLISAFIALTAGSYSGKTIANYVFGVRAWHILHGLDWSLNDVQIEALLKASEVLAPHMSKRKKRRPYTVEFICSLHDKLDLDTPLDAAVYSCLTTAFYCTARVGEVTVPTLSSFEPSIHVKPSDMRIERDRSNLEMRVFHIPRTKISREGEDISFARQNGPSDPEQALIQHLRINEPPPGGALFAYRFKKGYRPLTKQKFIGRLAQAARAAGLDPLQGHSIRIGSTLEYLLRNIPFEVVKTKGRWASDAFQLYLRKHAQVLAPYMQAVPSLHEEFIRFSIPRNS